MPESYFRNYLYCNIEIIFWNIQKLWRGADGGRRMTLTPSASKPKQEDEKRAGVFRHCLGIIFKSKTRRCDGVGESNEWKGFSRKTMVPKSPRIGNNTFVFFLSPFGRFKIEEQSIELQQSFRSLFTLMSQNRQKLDLRATYNSLSRFLQVSSCRVPISI